MNTVKAKNKAASGRLGKLGSKVTIPVESDGSESESWCQMIEPVIINRKLRNAMSLFVSTKVP